MATKTKAKIKVALTGREARDLLRSFEIAYELAYRRGFHHGYVNARPGPGEQIPTEKQISDWRHGPVRHQETRPPECGDARWNDGKPRPAGPGFMSI
jgi:hypothetical protein